MDSDHRLIIPGLVDCHAHMTGFGKSLQTLNLRDVKSIREMQQRLRSHAEQNPEKRWILGGRWDQEKFSEKRYPTRWDLDAAVADRPVFLMRVCGHVGVANSKALQMAGVKKDAIKKRGSVDLDAHTGELNGLLREDALQFVWDAIPEPSLNELEEACLSASREAVKIGLTGVHWIVGSARELLTIQKLKFKEKLPVRVYLGIPVELLDEMVNLGLLTGFGNNMVKIGFVKILADGSLGAHTAALEKAYHDKLGTKGMMLFTQRRLNSMVSKAHKAGLQLAVHAIGDRAVKAVLKAYDKALKDNPREDHRHRIEHCSVLGRGLIRDMKSLKLIASIQPHFVVSDFWIGKRVGKRRARWVYAFKTMLKEGIVLAAGSDCPVEPLNPILGIWAAVARKDFFQERLTVEEALRAYTINAAYASFDEDIRGTIEVGKLADLTVLSRDIFHISADKIRTAEIEMTVVGGKIVYRAQSA